MLFEDIEVDDEGLLREVYAHPFNGASDSDSYSDSSQDSQDSVMVLFEIMYPEHEDNFHYQGKSETEDLTRGGTTMRASRLSQSTSPRSIPTRSQLGSPRGKGGPYLSSATNPSPLSSGRRSSPRRSQLGSPRSEAPPSSPTAATSPSPNSYFWDLTSP
jgi:hypothetical protein